MKENRWISRRLAQVKEKCNSYIHLRQTKQPNKGKMTKEKQDQQQVVAEEKHHWKSQRPWIDSELAMNKGTRRQLFRGTTEEGNNNDSTDPKRENGEHQAPMAVPSATHHEDTRAADQQISPPTRHPEASEDASVGGHDPQDNSQLNLSFCGCGFLGIYHVGVASCFHEYAPQLSMHKIAGSSAGALVAAAHICGNLQLAYATTDIMRVAIDARARTLGPFHPSFDINATVRQALEKGLPDDVQLRVSGRLHVSLTRAHDGANVIISEFESKEDVIQVLLCSCFIPFWSGLMAPKFKGVTYIDGGFSNNLLTLDDQTIIVSPFSGEADICPQDDSMNLLQLNLSNTSFSLSPDNLYRLSHALLPPPPEIFSDLCEQGFADGVRFLQQMKLISCTKCLDVRSSLSVTTSAAEEHHIRLERTERKFIEINTNSVVSTTSQTYRQHVIQTTTTTTEFTFNESRQVEQQQSCDDCVLIREKASMNKSLPKQFSDRIEDACDTVNRSLSNWVYSHRPIKYLSYLAAPYYLPIDVSIALLAKCCQQLLANRFEFVAIIGHVVECLLEIFRGLQSQSNCLQS